MMTTCSLPDCNRPHYARGWCNPHYQRWRKHGDPTVLGRTGRPPRTTPPPTCTIDGCNERQHGRTYCYRHYRNLYERGDPLKDAVRWSSLEERFWAKVNVREPDDCWEWTAATSEFGYGIFGIGNKNNQAHRVSYWLEHGRWPEPFCLHSCDNPPCVNPAHLREGTQAENTQDKMDRNRQSRTSLPGALNPHSKLTEAQVADIRRRYDAGGVSQQALGDKYGIHQTAISSIVRRQQWR